jgi:hypothetical protein
MPADPRTTVRRLALVAALPLALVVAGCGGDDAPSSIPQSGERETTTTESTTTTTAATTTTAEGATTTSGPTTTAADTTTTAPPAG